MLDTKPHEVLRHWAKCMGVEWERDDYANAGRLRLVRDFFAEHPSATLQDATDAIDGAWLQPQSFWSAKQLRTIFGEHFESFRGQGRQSREWAAKNDKRRAKEFELEELEARQDAEVISLGALPAEALAAAAKAFGVRR